ncbi:hypothetical protein E9531_14345 [Lampropedia puyangensis]|uniref:Uncharacterized protein n=1 Tax=Lampropedia puyangensis TaxID=1330072 RepID=A0A4S8EUH5_9BURK|nr:hypothetical protein [Lampropedia puyangensis]THT98499.1 hypothetical protein E9531_14345 [Lampropedia puyangensis]
MDRHRSRPTHPAAHHHEAPQGKKANGDPHLVPLTSQAITALENVRTLSGHGRYVAPLYPDL